MTIQFHDAYVQFKVQKTQESERQLAVLVDPRAFRSLINFINVHEIVKEQLITPERQEDRFVLRN